MDRVTSNPIAASEARNADGQSDWLDVGSYYEGIMLVDVTALTASDTIDFTIEITDAAESSTYVVTHTTFTQITAAGKAFKQITNFGSKLRLKWNVTLAGVNTTTFSARFEGKARL